MVTVFGALLVFWNTDIRGRPSPVGAVWPATGEVSQRTAGGRLKVCEDIAAAALIIEVEEPLVRQGAEGHFLWHDVRFVTC